MCGRPNSLLTERAKEHPYVDLLEFVVPAGTDGFLATNSLLAFAVLIARAYSIEFRSDDFEAGVLDIGLVDRFSGDSGLTRWRSAMEPLWSRETTVVLHGSTTKCAAIDLELKFTEAALGHLQIADYRNFAHGRHHWLAKRGQDSGVLAITAPDDRDVAEKTLALIPENVPVARIDFEGDYMEASLGAIVMSLHVAGWAGSARGIDPGRPGVPEFGRRLYNLLLPKGATTLAHSTLSASDVVAIERKAGLSIDRLVERGDLTLWCSALRDFKKALSDTVFGAVVLDYDGTIVDTRARFVPPNKAIIDELEQRDLR